MCVHASIFMVALLHVLHSFVDYALIIGSCLWECVWPSQMHTLVVNSTQYDPQIITKLEWQPIW